MKIFALSLFIIISSSIAWAQDTNTEKELQSTEDKESITNLNLQNRKLTSFPQSLKGFENLKILDLSNNQISEIPSWLSKLKKLKALIIDNNLIKELPGSLVNAKSLEAISVYNNPLTKVNENIAKLPNFEGIILGGPKNEIVKFPTSFNENTVIIYIDSISSVEDKVKILHDNFPTNMQFSRRRNFLDYYNEPQLVSRIEFDQYSIDKRIAQFANLYELEINDFEHRMTSLPEEIRTLKHLTKLTVHIERIEELPEWIGDLSNLKYLNIEGCSSIKELPESLGKLKNLEHINIKSTGIYEVPDYFKNFTSLKGLKLGGANLFKDRRYFEDIASKRRPTEDEQNENYRKELDLEKEVPDKLKNLLPEGCNIDWSTY